jgi:transcriptional regulator with XRE-family HTH domain
MIDIPTIGSRLKAVRKQRGLTQAELGKLAGMTTSSIAQYETDARQPDINNLCKLCTALKVSADKLLGLDIVTASVLMKLSQLSIRGFEIVMGLIDIIIRQENKK